MLFCHTLKSRIALKKGVTMMSKRDIVGYLGISMKTLYNWEKERPNLYKTVMKGLAYDEIVKLNEETYKKAKEMSEKFGK
jgi:transcriptional regulator with XRE-family HTH domain